MSKFFRQIAQATRDDSVNEAGLSRRPSAPGDKKQVLALVRELGMNLREIKRIAPQGGDFTGAVRWLKEAEKAVEQARRAVSAKAR